MRLQPCFIPKCPPNPKRIALNFYYSIPHLLTPVAWSPKQAPPVLQNVGAGMARLADCVAMMITPAP